MFKVILLPEVEDDLILLDSDILSEVDGYMKQYEINPFACSQPLVGNLASCRKTYIANATYRIIIKVENNIAKIVSVVAVGKREEKEVYRNAHDRINNNI